MIGHDLMMENREPIDIHSEMLALCEALRLPYSQTVWVHFEPAQVTALVFKLNENGEKYVEKMTGEPATIELRFAVKT